MCIISLVTNGYFRIPINFAVFWQPFSCPILWHFQKCFIHICIYISLKGHGNEADFLGFLQKLVPHWSLQYLSSHAAFGFELAEIFVIEKQLPDSATLDLGSRQLPDSPSRRVGFWMYKRKLGELESWRLPNSASRRVVDSLTRRVGESLWWVGESLFKFVKI
jgi:hypothetical protein